MTAQIVSSGELARMLFKRRAPPTWLELLRISLWPRRSWFRSTQYVTKRVLRITATPHAIAAGVAIGVFTSFTPFLGLHFLFAFLLAWMFGGNLIATALGTFFGNPISFPLIWTATYQTGHFVLFSTPSTSGGSALVSGMGHVLSALWQFDFATALASLAEIWSPLLYPMLLGSVLLGPLAAVPLYMMTKRATIAFRERRRNQLMEKAKALRDQAARRKEASLLSKGSTT